MSEFTEIEIIKAWLDKHWTDVLKYFGAKMKNATDVETIAFDDDKVTGLLCSYVYEGVRKVVNITPMSLVEGLTQLSDDLARRCEDAALHAEQEGDYAEQQADRITDAILDITEQKELARRMAEYAEQQGDILESLRSEVITWFGETPGDGVRKDVSDWRNETQSAWTQWWNGIKDDWSPWFLGIKSDWESWFSGKVDSWTNWFSGIVSEVSEWFSGIKQDWSQWFGNASAAWDAWFATTKGDWSSWFAARKSEWTEWFGNASAAWDAWFATTKGDWSSWFTARKSEWTEWFTDTVSAWHDLVVQVTDRVQDLEDALDSTDDDVADLKTDMQVLQDLIGSDVDGTVNKFNEIVAFLAGMSEGDTLEAKLQAFASLLAQKQDAGDFATNSRVDEVEELVGKVFYPHFEDGSLVFPAESSAHFDGGSLVLTQ